MSGRICDLCPAPAAYFEPGDGEIRERDDPTFFDQLIGRGKPERCWCHQCWIKAFKLSEET